MKVLLLAILIAICAAVAALAVDAPTGACAGGERPAQNCKTCETCFYCGRKGRWGVRPENSGTCVVCQAAREAEKKAKKP
jgi:hypothetical protein